MSSDKTALVFGGGGMFGAYQAGAWATIAPHFKPDLVVGASIGALNGWVAASEEDPQKWVDRWLNLEEAADAQFRFPRSLTSGCIDTGRFESFIRTLHTRYKPVVPFAAVVTELRRLKPQTVEAPQVTWQHLAASCAVPLIMPQYKLEGRYYIDGGFLGALPLWAAARLGATRILGINIMPPPPMWLSPFQRALRVWSKRAVPAGIGQECETVVLSPRAPLGSVRDTAFWNRDRAEQMVDAGRREAEALLPKLKTWLSQERPQVEMF